jgi:hypothetical protein
MEYCDGVRDYAADREHWSTYALEDYLDNLPDEEDMDEDIDQDNQDQDNQDQDNQEQEEFFRNCEQQHSISQLRRQPEIYTDEEIYEQMNELYPPDQEIQDERYDHSRWNVQCYPEYI